MLAVAAVLSMPALADVHGAAGTQKGEAAPGAVPLAQTQAQDDWARVKKAGKLVIGTAADYPPFEYYNSNYQFDGFDIALARELGKRLGVQVEFNDFAFDGLLDALRLGQVDVAMAAISVTPNRQEIVDFTNLYYIGEDAALTRTSYQGNIRSATDLAGMKVGVQRGTTYQVWAQENLVDKGVIEQENLVAFQDVPALVRDLRNGKVDVVLLGLLPAQQQVQRYSDLKIAGQNTNKQQFAIAARTNSTLVPELNRALLATQQDGAFAVLAKQYLGVSSSEVLPGENDAIPEPTPAPAPTATPGPPPCVHGMAYVADLNYDDKNMTAPPVMSPGQQFTKKWRVRNTGTCAWEPDFKLRFVSGNRPEAKMDAVPVPVGKRVERGQTVDLAANLRAPQNWGTYQAFWKMQDNQGKDFGEVIWVGIQVPNPNPPPTPTPPRPGINPNLRADAAWINAGQCTAIRWDVDNINAVYFVDGGNVQGVGGHDSRTVCPAATTTYVLRVVGRDNRPLDFPITINVTGSAPATINFWVDNGTINAGQCTTLRWDVQNVQAVYLNEQGVAGTGSQQVCPGNTTTYTLRVVRRDGGQETRQVTVNVISAPQPGPTINSFTVNANQIRIGQCVTLTWRTTNANSVNLVRNGVILLSNWNPNASLDDCPSPPGLYEYELDAFGNGQTSQRIMVEVR
jgi:polar amino acid transport system substrate-binding protein